MLKNYIERNNGVISLSLNEEEYNEFIKEENNKILKESQKLCENSQCNNSKNMKCVYHLGYEKWLCPKCLKILNTYDFLMRGLGIGLYGNERIK